MASTSPARGLGAEVVAQRGPRRRAGDDDLLTAGLSLDELRALTPPPDATPRRMAHHRDIREHLDVTAEGGFGRLFGPPSLEALRVTGVEITALLRLPGRRHPFTVQVLIPDAFDAEAPCLIVAPSSGSRGVTGAIGDIGAWALTHGCALALTDKGTGVGAQILATGEVYDMDGDLAAPRAEPTTFALKTTAALRRFSEANPHAIALKHAHSRENVEADWPAFVLAAARYGLAQLSAHAPAGRGATPHVIAAGVSNGGGAVLRAAEADRAGVLDAVVAAEPQITPRRRGRILVVEGSAARMHAGLALYDVASTMTLLAPVAALAPVFANYPLAELVAPLRPRHEAFAAALARAGLLEGTTPAAQAQAALARLRALHFGPESDPALNAMVALQVWPAVTATFANALGRFGVEDALAGVTFAFADLGASDPRAPTPEEKAALAGRCGGLAPSGGVALVDHGDAAGMGPDAALALRRLWTSRERESGRVRRGAREVLAHAKPRGVATIIIHGRGDSLLNPTHTSRAYVAAAARAGRNARQLRYYEVDGAQHFDTLLNQPGFSAHVVPLNPYVCDALRMARETVRTGASLPPSQRIRATPPPLVNGARPPLEHGHLGAIAMAPHESDRIHVAPGRIVIPTAHGV